MRWCVHAHVLYRSRDEARSLHSANYDRSLLEHTHSDRMQRESSAYCTSRAWLMRCLGSRSPPPEYQTGLEPVTAGGRSLAEDNEPPRVSVAGGPGGGERGIPVLAMGRAALTSHRPRISVRTAYPFSHFPPSHWSLSILFMFKCEQQLATSQQHAIDIILTT